VLIIVFFVLEPHGFVGLGGRIASVWSRVRVRAREDAGGSQEAQAIERGEARWAR
jgi:hypothetical protein